MLLTKLLGATLSPGGARGNLSVLIFHRVLSTPDPLFPDEPDVNRFAEILSWVGRAFNVIPLAQGLAGLKAGTLPPRALAITFDDGYQDNFTVALPVLQRFGMHATFFVASGFLDGGRMWNDTVIESVRACTASRLDLDHLGLGRHDLSSPASRRRAIDTLLPQIKYMPLIERTDCVQRIAEAADVHLPSDLMMRSAQLASLSDSGMEIGGHTRTHPILARLPDADALHEIKGGKADIESIIGKGISLFAYPNGKPGKDYLARHVDMVRSAGFQMAVSTAPGVARPGCDLFQVPRFTPWDKTATRFGLRLVSNMRFAGALAP